MTTRSIPSESVEFLEFGLDSDDDPTTGTVEVGFTSLEEMDAPGTFVVGTWNGTRGENVGDFYTEAYIARFLFGTGSLDLAEGEYIPWIRVTLGSEVIVRRLGRDKLIVT